jgi:hypothetical protein
MLRQICLQPRLIALSAALPTLPAAINLHKKQGAGLSFAAYRILSDHSAKSLIRDCRISLFDAAGQVHTLPVPRQTLRHDQVFEVDAGTLGAGTDLNDLFDNIYVTPAE